MISLPHSCRIAFKEWSGVCDALMTGRQTIIVRKGGILEGPGGFTPEHSFFWLYPTHVHQAEQGLRQDREGETVAPPPPPTSMGRVMIQAFVAVEMVHFVRAEESLPCSHLFTS